MSDRPHDQGGSDGQPSGQGSPSSPYPGPGEQPLSLSKGGGDAPAPSYGYGPPSYGEQSVPYDSAQPPTNHDVPTAGYDQQGSFTPPPPGPAGGYGTYGPPAGPGPYGSPPPRKKRTGLIIGIIAGGLVVVIALVIGLVAILAGGGGKPSETVQAYLQALSSGDAPKALEQGEKPPDTTFATSDALKAQQDIAKITDIDVSEGYSGSRSARVSATYKFGDKQADESFSLTKIGGEWKLDDVVYPIDLTGLGDVPGLTLMGIDASGKNKAYVFPGPLVWGSSNEYLSVTESEPDDFTLSPSDGAFSFSTLETSLSDDGEKAVAEAVTTYIDECAKAKTLTPDGCPQDEYDYEAVEGTAKWTAPDDLSALEYRTSSPVTEVYVSGTLTWSVSYTAEDYDGKRTTKTADDVDGSLYGTVDLTQDPPVYKE